MGDRDPDPDLRKLKMSEYEADLLNNNTNFESKLKSSASRCPKADIKTFTITAILKKGRWGHTYEARRGDIDYAIKQMGKAEIIKENQVEAVVKEKRYQYAMDHPCLLTLYYKAKDFLNVYLIMEHVAHCDMLSIAATYPNRVLPEERLLLIFRQVVAGLEYMHSCYVIHRNIKSSSIIICEGGRAKIGGFGLACDSKALTHQFGGDP